MQKTQKSGVQGKTNKIWKVTNMEAHTAVQAEISSWVISNTISPLTDMKNQYCYSRFNLIFTFIEDIQACGLKGRASIKSLTKTTISFFSSSHL